MAAITPFVLYAYVSVYICIFVCVCLCVHITNTFMPKPTTESVHIDTCTPSISLAEVKNSLFSCALVFITVKTVRRRGKSEL